MLPNLTVAEAEPHGLKIFPHMYADDDILRLLPKLGATPVQTNIEDWVQGDVEAWRRSTGTRNGSRRRRTRTQRSLEGAS